MIGGILLAADGQNRRTLLDVIDTPFYGGNKLLLRDKLFSSATRLVTGEPLVTAPMKALFEARQIDKIAIVVNPDQIGILTTIARLIADKRDYILISATHDVGTNVAEGIAKLSCDYTFVLQADLPFVTGVAIDHVLEDMDKKSDLNLTLIDEKYFNEHAVGWKHRYFPKFQEGGVEVGLKCLDFGVFSTQNCSEFVRKVYSVRSIRSLKGKINALREFPLLYPQLALQYLTTGLSLKDLELVSSRILNGSVSLRRVSHPMYAAFTCDIDTLADHGAYKRKIALQNGYT